MGKYTTVSFFTAICAIAATSAFSESVNWDGVYIGGMIGKAKARSDTHVSYGNSLDTNRNGGNTTSTVGWTDNAFYGDVYNSLNTISLTTDTTASGNATASGSAPDSINLATSSIWKELFSPSQSNVQRTLLIGANRQYGQFVFGGEARFAFGDFGRDFSASTSTSLSDSASSWVTGVSSGGTTADWFDLYEYLSIVDFTDNTSISNDPIPNVPYAGTPTSSVLTGTGDAATLWNYSEISWANSWNGEGYTNNTTVYAQYYQTSTFHAGVNFNRIMSPTLRAGITAGKAMFLSWEGRPMPRLQLTHRLA